MSLRRAFAGALAVLGIYYGALGIVTLVRLPTLTQRWIEATGDPDFRFDFEFFAVAIGFGAAMVATLGVVTATRAVRMASGDRG